MEERTAPRTAVVADRRPLERGLVRFLLEERGLVVAAEAGTMADTLLEVQSHRPDLVVLHEKLALDHNPTVIEQIRWLSPGTSLVLLAADPAALPPQLVLVADTVVHDGPGLTELGMAVAGDTRFDAIATDEAEVHEIAESPGSVPGGVGDVDRNANGRRWWDRFQGVAAASIIALAIVLGRGFIAEPSLAPQAQIHLAAAWESLDDLETALAGETPTEIADIASTLVAERAAAQQAGADLYDLDQAVQAALTEVWGSLSPETQGFVVALLEDVFVDNGEEPPPLESPAPSTTSEPPPQDDSDGPPSQTTTQPPDPATEPPPGQGPPPGEGPPPGPSNGPPPTEPPVPTTTEPPPPTTTTPTPTPPTTTMTTLTLTTTATPTSETQTITAIDATPTTTITITRSAPPPTTSVPPTTTAPPTTSPPPTTTSPPPTTTSPPPTTTLPPTSSTPTSTVQPAPGETRSASFAALPFALLLMTAASGWLRHRARRTGDDDGSSPGAS